MTNKTISREGREQIRVGEYASYDNAFNCTCIDLDAFKELLSLHNPDAFEVVEGMQDYEVQSLVLHAFDNNMTGKALEGLDGTEGENISIYYCTTYTQLAEEFCSEGLFGEIPDHLERYIDYEAMAYDLKHDYNDIIIDHEFIIYRND